MTPSGLPFDDFRNLLANLPPLGEGLSPRREDRIAEIAALVSRCAGRSVPRIARPQLALFVGTHSGIDVSPDDQAHVVKRRIEKLAAGEDPLNRLCLAADLSLKVYDLALDLPVADIAREPALDERACAATMAFGMEAVGGTDLLCISALETDGGRSAGAILEALSGNSEAVPEPHRSHLRDPLELLRRLGGRETAAVTGAILAARVQKVPVLLDGPTAIAAAAVLHAVNKDALAHCMLADAAGEAHREVAARFGLMPLTALDIDPGEGASGGLAAGMV
jgi:nicotinate-nucleotide--dimethylbenzimidazole phosphoribosyltransferase